MTPITTILCPIDLSPSSEQTMSEACRMAHDRQARLIALYVAPKSVVSHVEGASELPPEQAREKLWEAMRKPRPEEATVDIEHRIEQGDPVQGILRVARETRCDLIVVGMHPKSGWTGWLMGGTAEKVIQKAPCSVLVVKDTAAAESQELPSETALSQHETCVSSEHTGS